MEERKKGKKVFNLTRHQCFKSCGLGILLLDLLVVTDLFSSLFPKPIPIANKLGESVTPLLNGIRRSLDGVEHSADE